MGARTRRRVAEVGTETRTTARTSNRPDRPIRADPNQATTAPAVPAWRADPLTERTFTCAHCRGVYAKGQSDEEARAEYEATMPQAVERGDEEATVCDDCYRAILRWAEQKGLNL